MLQGRRGLPLPDPQAILHSIQIQCTSNSQCASKPRCAFDPRHARWGPRPPDPQAILESSSTCSAHPIHSVHPNHAVLLTHAMRGGGPHCQTRKPSRKQALRAIISHNAPSAKCCLPCQITKGKKLVTHCTIVTLHKAYLDVPILQNRNHILRHVEAFVERGCAHCHTTAHWWPPPKKQHIHFKLQHTGGPHQITAHSLQTTAHWWPPPKKTAHSLQTTAHW